MSRRWLWLLCPCLALGVGLAPSPQPLATAVQETGASTPQTDRAEVRETVKVNSQQAQLYKEVIDRQAVAVIIDNFNPDARPQSGLQSADVVFEALAEGGITRFMAVYTSHDAAIVGPVRSTRLYFNSWAAGFGAILGHDGGNVDALQQLPSLTGLFNIDADTVAAPFWRSSTRLPPHNEYVSTTSLRLLAPRTGAREAQKASWLRKPDAPVAARPTSFNLRIQFSYSGYQVAWRYDPATNQYLRFEGGRPQFDARSHRQIRAKNVVVMYLRETAAYDPFTPDAIHLATVGVGRAVVYRDGESLGGMWLKPSVESQVRWIDSQGQEIALDKGSVWVEAVPVGDPVSAVTEARTHPPPQSGTSCRASCRS